MKRPLPLLQMKVYGLHYQWLQQLSDNGPLFLGPATEEALTDP